MDFQTTATIQSNRFVRKFVRNILLQLVSFGCVESALRMTQDASASDNEFEENVDSDRAKFTTDHPDTLHATASSSPKRTRPSQEINLDHKDIFLDPKKLRILDWYKDAAHRRPACRGKPGETMSRDDFYKEYYCDKSSSITFMINGIPQSFKRTSILDAPFIDPRTNLLDCTDTSTRPDHPSTVASGK